MTILTYEEIGFIEKGIFLCKGRQEPKRYTQQKYDKKKEFELNLHEYSCQEFK